MTDRSPEDQAVFDRHPDIPQPTLDDHLAAFEEAEQKAARYHEPGHRIVTSAGPGNTSTEVCTVEGCGWPR